MHRSIREHCLDMKKEIIMRRALPGDVEDFVSLIILSAPLFFKKLYGNRFKSILQYLFLHQHNLFSFNHVYFAESGGRKAGMILEYDWRFKKQEDLRTGLLLLKYMELNFIKRLPLFLKVRDVTGWVNREEHYISNVAVYPEYRGMGIGTDLIAKVEMKARKNGAKKVVLDVEVENLKAIKLYKKLGYAIVKESSIRVPGELFYFYRMYKKLK